ncbi:hypothetical protein D3C71_1347820 [compost metagenome]
MIEPAQEGEEAFVIDIEMDAEIRKRPPARALAGMGITGAEQNEVADPLVEPVAAHSEQLLAVQHIIDLILGVGVDGVIPFSADLSPVHAEQVERRFDVGNDHLADACLHIRGSK